MGVVSLYREIFKNYKFNFMVLVILMLSVKKEMNVLSRDY